MLVLVIIGIVIVAIVVILVVYSKHAAELFFRKRGSAGRFLEKTIKCPQMFLNITFALALADRQGQAPQIILAVRGMILILV